MENVTDYTGLLNRIITILDSISLKIDDLKGSQDLLFLILAIFLVIFVLRGE